MQLNNLQPNCAKDLRAVRYVSGRSGPAQPLMKACPENGTGVAAASRAPVENAPGPAMAAVSFLAMASAIAGAMAETAAPARRRAPEPRRRCHTRDGQPDRTPESRWTGPKSVRAAPGRRVTAAGRCAGAEPERTHRPRRASSMIVSRRRIPVRSPRGSWTAIAWSRIQQQNLRRRFGRRPHSVGPTDVRYGCPPGISRPTEGLTW